MHEGKVAPTEFQQYAEPPSPPDLPYQISLVKTRAYLDEQGEDWESLQQWKAKGYEVLLVTKTAEVPDYYIIVLEKKGLEDRHRQRSGNTA